MKNKKSKQEFLGTVGVISLGCSKNRINTEQMMFLLHEAGYFVTGEISDVDIVLLNTCGFIKSAKDEAVETILELVEEKKQGKIGKLIVAGCFPQRYKKHIMEDLPDIDAVVGTGSFNDIVNVIKNQGDGSSAFFDDINAPVSETPRIISTSPVWAYLKIAEGCDNRCAFCCIPDIRGNFRSRPIENIISEAKKLAEKGILELILVAQDLTRYGLDLYGEKKLTGLLTSLSEIEGLKWIRLHYLYPDEFDDELIEIISKSDKILKYLDIPIQHINDDILKKMNRRGTGQDIRTLFKRIREKIPEVVLRTSLITGLPGEGEKEYKELCKFLKEAKIERVGVFAYSPEEGTAAALMERPTKEIAEKRADDLNNLQQQIMQKWNETRIGTVTDVIIEDIITNYDGTSYLTARSFAESPEIDGYILVKNHGDDSQDAPGSTPVITEDMMWTLSPCLITGIENGELVGEPT